MSTRALETPAIQRTAPHAEEFKRALRQYPTGVTIITTQTPSGRRAGVTISSFNTLSLDPPLILWSLSLTAPSLELFRDAKRFAVNVLSHEQGSIALQFARPSDDKFSGIAISDGIGGVPLIAGASAHLECSVFRRDPGGDHEIYLGMVEKTCVIEREPLVYMQGRFGKFSHGDNATPR